VTEFRSGQYLTFRVGRHDFAMLADSVRGVLPIHELVSEERPSSLAGHATMQGETFPVFDLRVKLNLRGGVQGRNPSIVVVSTAEGLAGFVADGISEVVYARQRDYRAGKIRLGRARPVIDAESLELVTL
jgi:hypothetical protein